MGWNEWRRLKSCRFGWWAEPQRSSSTQSIPKGVADGQCQIGIYWSLLFHNALWEMARRMLVMKGSTGSAGRVSNLNVAVWLREQVADTPCCDKLFQTAGTYAGFTGISYTFFSIICARAVRLVHFRKRCSVADCAAAPPTPLCSRE
jgi:hypothetical protein